MRELQFARKIFYRNLVQLGASDRKDGCNSDSGCQILVAFLTG
jgi:hypothetical protein